MQRIMGAIILLVALTGCGSDPEPTRTGPMSEWDKQQAGASSEPAADATMREVTVDDVALSVKTKEKNCFGSAGCNVTVEIVPVVDELALFEDRTTEVTYELTGVEDGPVVGTIELGGDGRYTQETQYVSTTTSGAVLEATPTSVSVY